MRIEAWDRVGLLRDITTVVTEDKVNMVGVRTIENGDGSVTIQATLETTGIEQLSAASLTAGNHPGRARR